MFKELLNSTTGLAVLRFITNAVGIGTVAAGTVSVTTPEGEAVTLPPIGQKWYVYIPFLLSAVLSVLKGIATQDKK